MSIRIQTDSLSGATAPGVGRADEASPLSGRATPASGKAGQRGTDSVEISSLSQSFTAANSAEDAHQASRVKQLAALYRSGQYQMDSASVSRAMVSQALTAGSGEDA